MKINDEKFLDGDKIVFTKKNGKKASIYFKNLFISNNFRGDYKYNPLQLMFNPFLKNKYNIVFSGNPLIEPVDILIVPNKKILLKNLNKRKYCKQSNSNIEKFDLMYKAAGCCMRNKIPIIIHGGIPKPNVLYNIIKKYRKTGEHKRYDFRNQPEKLEQPN